MLMKELIDKSGIPIPEIAASMGITRQRLYQIIDNPKRIKATQILKLAEAINVSPKTIITLIQDGK